MDKADRQKLATYIMDAFKKSEYPGDDNLGWGEADAFIGKKRDDLSAEVLRKYEEALTYFSPEAFRYYLPVYLYNVIMHPAPMDVVVDGIIFILTPLDKSDIHDKRLEHLDLRAALVRRTQAFSQEENVAVYKFISNYADLEPDSSWVTDRYIILQKAIEFWKEKATPSNA